MIARAVIGANFGDEGKGLVTDYLCSRGGQVVVRFNGGAQSGHTVYSQGVRHVFSHFGSGTLLGVPTFLSQFFIVNPVLFFRELELLDAHHIAPQVFAHPDCLVTTFADMMINQRKETKRGDKRHGSCGVGIHETIQRSTINELKITMSDLWNGSQTIERKLTEICERYARFRSGGPIIEPKMSELFIKMCQQMANIISPAGIGQCKDPIFEGGQGLMLDQDCKQFWPHVTHSKTGMHNVRLLCAQAGIDEVEPWYVSRTYMTRHGAGPLPNEDDAMSFDDDTNLNHPFQGQLRFGRLNVGTLHIRCRQDAQIDNFNLVFTHCDQLAAPKVQSGPIKYFYSYGPTRGDIFWGKDEKLRSDHGDSDDNRRQMSRGLHRN